jgi:hypothetical protein
MAVLEKFNQKNKSVLAKLESVEDTYNAPAATDATPAISLSGSVTNEIGTYTYIGKGRGEQNYLKDKYADFKMETPQQILGALNGSLAVNDVPLSEWYQASRGYVTVLSGALGSFAAGSVFIDNSQLSNSTLSVDYRIASDQAAGVEKLRKFTACRGTLDLNATNGDLPKLTFNMKGNCSDPVQVVEIVPDIGSQIDNVAVPIRDTSIVDASIVARGGTYTAFGGTISTITKAANIATATASAPHSLGANGSIRFANLAGATDSLYNGIHLITIISTTKFIYTMLDTPAADASGTFTMTVGAAAKNFCFDTLTATNFFGIDIKRYTTGCEVGFDSTEIPSDVSATILELPAPLIEVTAIASTTTTATATAAHHGLEVGNSITVDTGDANYDGTFTVVSVPDADSFTYTIASYSGTFSGKGTVLNNSYAKFDPDSNISEFFGAQIKFGTAAGNYVTYKWDNLQIKDSKDGTVGDFLGRSVDFRNTGNSFIILE